MLTNATVSTQDTQVGYLIVGIDLDITARIEKPDLRIVQRAVALAGDRCTVIRALNVPIRVDAKLVGTAAV